MTINVIAGVITLGIGIAFIVQLPPSPQQVTSETQFQLAGSGGLSIRKKMRNPDSLVIESAIVMDDDKTVYYTFRSQNGFGGMGSGRAVVIYGLAIAPILNSNSDLERGEFVKLWNKHCAESGTDVTEKVEYFLQHDTL